MRSHLLFILFLGICFNSIAQVVVVEAETKEPIAFVHLVSESGKLLANSDINGENQFDLHDIIRSEMYVFQHIAYENRNITGEELSLSDTIFMQKKMFILPEIIVSNDRSVIVLKAYFRCYELNDSVPKYFTDGIVKYYIDDKNRVKMELLEYRSFKNNLLIQKQKQRTNTIIMNLATIPRMDNKSIIEILQQKKYKTKLLDTGEQVIMRDATKVGTIKHDEAKESSQLSVDFIIPKPYVEKRIFNYISQIYQNQSIEIYSGVELPTLSPNELLRRKNYREILFKHKKDKEFVRLQAYNELYVFDRTYTNEKEFNKLKSSSHAFPNSSFYEEEYWLNMEKYNIPNVNNSVGDILEKLPNVH